MRMDPHHFGKLDPDPYLSENQDKDPHQIKKVVALESHLGSMEGPNPGKK